MSKNVKHLLPFVILVLLIIIVYLSNIHEKFTLERIRDDQQYLLHYAQAHPFLTPLIFIGIYIISVCLVIPDSTLLTLLGGLIFPLPLAVIYTLFSETIGATVFFAIFQGLFGTSFVKHERPFFSKMRMKFNKHRISYLLFLRLSHIFPFWLTNVTAAYFKVNYWTFIWTCFLGTLPLTILLTDAGHSLNKLFKTTEQLTLSDVFTTEIKLTLIVLGLLALFPIIFKKILRRKHWK